MKKILFLIILLFPTFVYSDCSYYGEFDKEYNINTKCDNGKTIKLYSIVDGIKVFEVETDTKDTPLWVQSHKNIFGDIITLVSTFEAGYTLSKSDEKIEGLYFNGKKLDKFYDLVYDGNGLREYRFTDKQKKLFLTEAEKQNIKKVMKENPDKITIEKVENYLKNYKNIYDIDEKETKKFLVLAYIYLEQFR